MNRFAFLVILFSSNSVKNIKKILLKIGHQIGKRSDDWSKRAISKHEKKKTTKKLEIHLFLHPLFISLILVGVHGSEDILALAAVLGFT